MKRHPRSPSVHPRGEGLGRDRALHRVDRGAVEALNRASPREKTHPADRPVPSDHETRGGKTARESGVPGAMRVIDGSQP